MTRHTEETALLAMYRDNVPTSRPEFAKLRRVARNKLRRLYIWGDIHLGLVASHDEDDVPDDADVYWTANSNGRVVGPIPRRVLEHRGMVA